MDDVAAEAGVSRALVSLVMRGSPKVSDQRREAVVAAAARLGYRPNAAARRLAERRSNTLGVVIDDLHNTYHADVLDALHVEAEANGFRLLLNAAWLRGRNESQAVEMFLEYRVDALILLGSRLEPDALAAFAAECPIVVIGGEVSGVDVVRNDDKRGGELAVEHLVELGHTYIAHIDGGEGAGADRRRRGFLDACAAHGVRSVVIPGDFSEETGAEAIEHLLRDDELPTAIFAANDLVAVAAIDRLEAAGLKVPDDVSVVGYDNTWLAALRTVDLTTVNQPRREIGRVAARCAQQRVDGRSSPVTHVVTPDLVVRSTSGPPSVPLPEVSRRVRGGQR